MNEKIPQFVPSSTCLACDICCRFERTESPWRPKLTHEEARIIPQVDKRHYVKAVETKDGKSACQCVHFDPVTHYCAVYKERPFECGLYPFLIYKKNDKYWISVHLSCPHIKETIRTQEFQDFVVTLKNFFLTDPIRKNLDKYVVIAGQYEGFEEEIENIFPLPL